MPRVLSMLAAALGTVSAAELSALEALAERSRALHQGRIEPMLSTPHQKKIEHFVVLLKENRPFDHIIGCMDLPGADSAATMARNRTLLIDPSDPSKGSVNVTCGTANYVCNGGPGSSLWSQKFPTGSGVNVATAPYSPQSDANAYIQGAKGNAIEMFSPEQLPGEFDRHDLYLRAAGLGFAVVAAERRMLAVPFTVKTAMAKAFGVHNKLFTSVPSASSPNHLFSQSATSCGVMTNVNYGKCNNGTGGVTFPQLTVYDSMVLHNKSIKFYINLTDTQVWNDDGDKGHDHRSAPCSDAAAGPGIMGGSEFPDVCMDGVARHKDHFMNYSTFFEDAASGTLPNFAMIQPNGSRCDHPCADIAHGERLDKDIYEALRAGPAWNQTLFLIVWDDIGGFYDHIVPPHEGVAADEAPCHVTDGCPSKFDFKRLGGRAPAFLVSPWIPAGTVFQEPKSKSATSQFDLSSIPATAKELFNLTAWLTKRDEWAGEFAELLTLDEPTNQGPMHLPDAPPGYDERIAATASRRRLASRGPTQEVEEPAPQHCGREEQTCGGQGVVTTKQRRKLEEITALTHTPMPNTDQMSFHDADAFLAERFSHWMRHDYPRW